MKLAEVLVGFEDGTILNPPTNHIFKAAMSIVIVDVYVMSVSGMLIPLHGCWMNPTHLIDIDNNVDSAFRYVF